MVRRPRPADRAGSTSAELLRWGAATDLLSFYLPIGIVAYVLWRTLRPRWPLVADLSSLAAYGYALAGGSAAAVLAVVGPMLMSQYAAPGSDQASIEVAFRVLTEIVYRAIWQFLDALLLGAWWLGFGLLIRPEQPRLALLSFALAAAATIGAVLTLFGLRLAGDALAGVFFMAWLSWSIWLLVLLWRRSGPFDNLDGSHHSSRA